MSAPIRHTLRRQMKRGNLTILQAEVSGFDVATQRVRLDGDQALGYDHLIVAAAATHSYFGHDDWAAHAPGLKTLADAFAIRARVIGAFERAERCLDATQRDAWLTFVVIRAGPTGVEMTEIARHTLPQEYRRIDSRRTRVVLLEGSDHVLGTFVPALSQRAREQLAKLGVDVRTGSTVTGIDSAGVTCETCTGAVVQRHRVASKTVIWAAGVVGSKLGHALAAGAGAMMDRAGRVIVKPDLSLTGHTEIAVIGDLASAMSHPDDRRQGKPKPAPGVSPAAKQMGRAAAANLVRRLHVAPILPFRYIDHGNLATIGRKAAVVDLTVPGVGALRFSGYFAWLFWLFARIFFLIGFRNRLIVMFDWAWAYWTDGRSARVVAHPPSPPAP